MQLSNSFSLDEFLRSERAARMGKIIVPTDENIQNLKRLCVLALQPIRDKIGSPIVVLSGLRPLWLNGETPGSSKTSAHIDGRAADITVAGMTPLALCRAIQAMNLPIDQIIYEGYWAHVGIAAETAVARRQYLTARFANNSVTYETGINA